MADVWSCGVTLYVMLVGAYPFEDQDDPKNFRKTINVSFHFCIINHAAGYEFLWTYILFFSCASQKIMAVQYKIPDYVHVSQECRQLIARIFVANPSRVCYIFDSILIKTPKSDNVCIFSLYCLSWHIIKSVISFSS